MTTLEKAHKLIEKGKHRADWFEPSAEVVLATTAKETCEGALRADRQAIATLLCELLEVEKEVIRTVYDKQMEQRVHRLEEISKAKAIIRQTLEGKQE